MNCILKDWCWKRRSRNELGNAMTPRHRHSAFHPTIKHQNCQPAHTPLLPTVIGIKDHQQKKNSLLRTPQLKPERWERGPPMRQTRHLLCINMELTARTEGELRQAPRLSVASATPRRSTDRTDVHWRQPSLSTSRSTTNKPLIPLTRT